MSRYRSENNRRGRLNTVSYGLLRGRGESPYSMLCSSTGFRFNIHFMIMMSISHIGNGGLQTICFIRRQLCL